MLGQLARCTVRPARPGCQWLAQKPGKYVRQRADDAFRPVWRHVAGHFRSLTRLIELALETAVTGR